jgi:hypothetical protein
MSEYRIEKKQNGRYQVRLKGGQFVRGEEKTKVLLEKGLIKALKAKAKEAPPVAEQEG